LVIGSSLLTDLFSHRRYGRLQFWAEVNGKEVFRKAVNYHL
jgi:hypothetical protein